MILSIRLCGTDQFGLGLFLMILLSSHALRDRRSTKAVALEKRPKKHHQLARCPPELLHFRRHRYMYHLCQTAPSVAVAAYDGLVEAASECKQQMRFNRWDCTQHHPVRQHYTVLHNPPILNYGYRETAFLVALSSAGAAWSVATACVQGRLDGCACDVLQHSTDQSWQWGGCSYGVKYGLVTSRRLLAKSSRSHRQRSLMRQMEKHNLKAGRMAVKRTLVKACKCHGVSGSCQMKTCWQAASNLRTIGAHLKDKYAEAKFLLRNNSPNDSHHVVAKVRSAELVYMEQSPSYCWPLAHLRTAGTVGRTCRVRNDTHSEGDCDALCCTRGHRDYMQQHSEQCNCKFVWCCEVTCDRCLSSRWVSICR